MSDARVSAMRIPGCFKEVCCECRLFSVTVQKWTIWTHVLPEVKLMHRRNGYILHAEWLCFDLWLTSWNAEILDTIFRKRRSKEQYAAICRKS